MRNFQVHDPVFRVSCLKISRPKDNSRMGCLPCTENRRQFGNPSLVWIFDVNQDCRKVRPTKGCFLWKYTMSYNSIRNHPCFTPKPAVPHCMCRQPSVHHRASHNHGTSDPELTKLLSYLRVHKYMNWSVCFASSCQHTYTNTSNTNRTLLLYSTSITMEFITYCILLAIMGYCLLTSTPTHR